MEDKILPNKKAFETVMVRKKQLLERKRFTTDADELRKIDHQLEEIEVLLKKYKDPSTIRRRRVKKEDTDQ